MPNSAIDHGYDLMAVGRACIAYPDWAARIAAGADAGTLYRQHPARGAAHPGTAVAFLAGRSDDPRHEHGRRRNSNRAMFVETVQDEAGELVINVSLETDRIADIELTGRRGCRTLSSSPALKRFAHVFWTANTPHVDAISGATSQSEAVKKAVSKAMLKSSKALAGGRGRQRCAAPKSYDVVVVGSGGAGLAAAIQAHDEGASVLIVEKMPTIGGNTIKASAGMNAAETRFQRVKGIQDSKELFYQETLKGGHNKNNPAAAAPLR